MGNEVKLQRCSMDRVSSVTGQEVGGLPHLQWGPDLII